MKQFFTKAVLSLFCNNIVVFETTPDLKIQKFNKFAEKITTYASMHQDCMKTVNGSL